MCAQFPFIYYPKIQLTSWLVSLIMENPEAEIPNVVSLVTAAANPEIQKEAVVKYDCGSHLAD